MIQDVLTDSVVEATQAASTITFSSSGLHPILEDVFMPICIVAIVFGALFGVTFIFLRNRHKQHMLMIEKGVVAQRPHDPQRGLRISLVLLGAGLGWILADLGENKMMPFWAATGAALGYVVYYLIFEWKKKKKQE